MSNLPAKPEPGEISPRSPSQDDRHYTGRTVPMVSLSQYRREEPRRNDIYIARSPPRTRGPPIDSWDTYVARYDRREDDRCRREYTEWERHHGREYYRSRSRSAERRQRSTDRREHGGRNWEARHEYDRHDRGYRLNDRPPRSRNSADRDRRWRSRASVSPTRRAGSRHSPSERRRSPGPSRRRQTRSRSPSPSKSHPLSPTRRLRPEKRRRISRSRSGSPSHPRSLGRSITPENDNHGDTVSAVKRRSPCSSKSPRPQSRSRSESRVRTPVKAESVPDTVISNESQPSAKAKIKEEPLAFGATSDIKVPEPSTTLPTGPRSSLSTREPPKGPRGFVQPPTAPAVWPPHAKPDWSHRNMALSAVTPSFTHAEIPPKSQTEPEPVITASLPIIPPYKSKVTLNPELEAEIARVQVHRAHLTSEYTHIAKATRRALHELEMASLDLRAAENRRKLADSHVEKARLGVLGIDYLPTAST